MIMIMIMITITITITIITITITIMIIAEQSHLLFRQIWSVDLRHNLSRGSHNFLCRLT